MFLISYTSFLQVCTALSPDEQLNILINKWNKEKSNKDISEEDNERIKYYLNKVRRYIIHYIIISLVKKKLSYSEYINTII